MAFWAPTPRFCEEEVFGSYWHFLKKTEGINSLICGKRRENMRNVIDKMFQNRFFQTLCAWESSSLYLQNILATAPYCVTILKWYFMCDIIILCLMQVNFTSGHTLTIEIKFGSRDEIIRKIQNIICGVVKTYSCIQHNNSCHLAYLLSILSAGPGIRDPGSEIWDG
jgi:hypothetical protein